MESVPPGDEAPSGPSKNIQDPVEPGKPASSLDSQGDTSISTNRVPDAPQSPDPSGITSGESGGSEELVSAEGSSDPLPGSDAQSSGSSSTSSTSPSGELQGREKEEILSPDEDPFYYEHDEHYSEGRRADEAQDPDSDHDGAQDPYHDEYHDPYHDEYYDPDHYHNYHDEEYDPHAYDPAHSGSYPGSLGYGSEMDSAEEEEEGGGPIKTFLEHLEDLRWVLIRVAASVVLAMVLCLAGANHLTNWLKAPLESSLQHRVQTEDLLILQFGTNRFVMSQNESPATWLSVGESNTLQKLEVVPQKLGTNWVLTLAPGEVKEEDTRVASNPVGLTTFGPFEGFTVAVKVALYGGLVISGPLVLFFIAQFVVPALKREEKKLLFRGLAVGGVLFFLGVAFSYYLIMSIVLNAAVTFADWLGFSVNNWRASDYIATVCKFMLGMGLSFELPVILLTLVKIGLLDYKKLTAFRPYWVVINMVIGSILTPPDPISLFAMAIPLQLLYELSVLIAWIWGRNEERSNNPQAA